LGEEGALVRSVRDAAAVLDVVGGYVPGDPYTAPAFARPLREEIRTAPGNLRIGFMDREPSFHRGIEVECAICCSASPRRSSVRRRGLIVGRPSALRVPPRYSSSQPK